MKFFLVLLLFLSLTGNANILTYNVSANYILGDNDTKLEARRIALEEAKKLALEEAGTYIEVKTIIENGKLTKDEIKSYGATVLKIKIIKEDYFFKGVSPILKLMVKASINMTLLSQNIEKFKKNKGERDKVTLLQKENERLLNKVKELSKKFNKTNNIEQIRSERNELLGKIEKNHNILIKTFKKGSLLDLSKEYEKNTAKLTKVICNNYFNLIKNGTDIEIKNIEVKSNNDDTSDVKVYINWKVRNKKELIKMLKKYFTEEKYGSRTWCRGDNDERYYLSNLEFGVCQKEKGKYNQEFLFKALVSKQVLIEVSIKKYKKYLVISSGTDGESSNPLFRSDITDANYGTWNINLVFENDGISKFARKYIKFKNIPNKILSEIDEIKTKIIITKPIY